MKEFKLRFTADVADIEAQFKGAASELKKFAAGVASAENQLEALQQTGAYLTQMDKQLAELKKKYPDIFNKIFGNVDAQMKAALEPLAKSSTEVGKTVKKIGDQLSGIASGKVEATNTEMKKLGETVAALAKTMGMQTDLDFLNGTDKARLKAQKLIDVLSNLAVAYYKLDKASDKTDLGSLSSKGSEQEKPKRTKKKSTSKDSAQSDIKSNKEVAISYDELFDKVKRFRDLQNSWNAEKDRAKADKITNEMDKAASAIKKSLGIDGKKDRKLSGALSEIFNKEYESIEEIMTKIADLVGDRFPKITYDEIVSSVDKFMELQDKMNNPTITNEEYAKFEQEADDIVTKYKSINAEVESIFNEMQYDLSRDSAIEQLANVLNIDVSSTGINEISDQTAKAAEAARLKAEEEEKARIASEAAAETARLKTEEAEKARLAAEAEAKAAKEAAEAARLQAEEKERAIAAAKQLKEIKDTEAGAFYDSKTGKLTKITKGSKDSVSTSLDDYQNASKNGYDTRIHSHLWDVAAPSISSKENDFNAWLQVFDYIKKQAIVANKEILTFDFSSLTKETLQEIANKYKELTKPIVEDFEHPTPEKVQKWGGYGNVDEEMQRQLREALEIVMKDYSGVMSSVPIINSNQADSINAETDAIQKNNEAKKQAVSLTEQYRNANEEVKRLVGELAKLDDLDETDEIAHKWERLAEIAPGIYSSIMHGGEWDQLKQEILGTTSAVESAGTAIENVGTSGTAVEDLTAKAEAAKTKFFELTKSLDSDLSAGKYDEFSLGKSQAELDKAQQELKELADAGNIAADVMEEVDAAYKKTSSAISASYEGLRNENMLKEDSGSYDQGYLDAEKRFEQDKNSYIQEANELRHQVESLEQQLAQVKKQSTSGTGIDTQSEIEALKRLENKIFDVKHAIEEKIKAFVNEGKTVDSNVTKEIAALDNLLNKINEIKSAVDSKTAAFKTEGNVVSDSTKQAIKVKEKETVKKKEKDTFAADKKKLSESVYSYFNSLNLDFIPQDTLDRLAAMETRLKNITNSKDLSTWKQDWNEVTKSISQASKEQEGLALSSQKIILNGMKNSLAKAYKGASIDIEAATDEQKAFVQSYEELSSKLAFYAKNRRILSNDEISALEKEVKAVKDKANAYAQQVEAQKKAENIYGTKEIKSAQSKKESITGIATSDRFANSQEVEQRLSRMNAAYDALIAKQKEFKPGEETEDDRVAFQRLTDEFNKSYAALNELINSSDRLNKNARWSKSLNPGVDVSTSDKMKAVLEGAIRSSEKGKIKIGDLRETVRELDYSVQNQNGSWSHFTAKINDTGTAIVGFNAKAKQTDGIFKSLFTGASRQFKQAIARFTGFDVFYRGINEIKKGIQYVKEIDSALTELKKVTDETDASYAQFLQTMSKTGSEIGATVANLTNMAANWARLGYSMEEAGNLAKSTAVLLNVSEFTDAEKASEALISTIQAYGYAAEDSMHVVDVLNEIGNNFAISSDGIATALQDSASALMSAGNNLEQSVAMVAAANKVLQDPSQVGGALRTISLRIRGTSVEVLEEMGEETDGVVESASKLQAKLKGLTGVNILNDAGGYKDTYTIIKEIAEVWPEINDMNKAATLELLAGKNRSNAMAAMLTNLDDLTAAYEDALDAEGSAMSENEKYLDSIQGRIDQFTNSVQTMWMNALDSDAIKGFVDIGTSLINIFDQINNNNPIGIFGGLTVVGGTLFAAWKGIPALWTAIASATKVKVAEIVGETAAIKALNAQQVISNIAQADSISNDIKEAATSAIITGAKGKEKIATNLVTIEKIKEELAAKGVTGANADAVIAAMGLTNANAGLATSFNLVTKSILKFLATNPVGWAIIAAGAFATVIAINKKLKQAEEEVAQAALESGNSIKESNKSLDEYKNKVSELRKSLDKGNLSEAEAYETRKQLISIQDELISKYGQEAEGINLVTGSIEDQIDAIDRLAVANANDWLNKNSQQPGWFIFKGDSPIDQAIEAIEGTQDTYLNLGTNIFNKVFKDAYDSDKWKAESKKAALEYQRFVESLGGTLELDSNTIRFTNVTKEQIKDNYDKITNWLRDYAAKTGGKIDFQDMIGKISAGKEELLGDNFETQKANYDAYLENTAIASYTDAYGAILDEKEKFQKAYASGDKEAIREARKSLEEAIDVAQNEAGNDTRMVNWFGDLAGSFENAFKDIDFEDAWENTGNSLKSTIEEALKDIGVDTDAEILNIGSFIDENGKLKDGIDGITQEQVDAYNILKNKASEYGFSIEEIVAKLAKLGLIKSNLTETSDVVESVGKSFTNYASTIETLTDAQSISNELIYDNMELTKEQGEALGALIGSEAEYAEAVDTSNGYVVKNAKLVKDLIAKKKIEAAQNVKTEKTQARLKYYDLYKQIKKLSGANGELAAKNKDQINTLYAEMGIVQQTISKYSMLEQKLLGAADAYDKFEEAQTADSESDYSSKMTDMLTGLINGLQTGKVGTEAFKAAVKGLIPDEELDKLDTVKDKVKAIADYITTSNFKDYFNFEFDEDGALKDITMNMDNLKAFVEDGFENGALVQTGEDWTQFELSDQIKTLDDLAKAYGMTKEAAFAYLQLVNQYDGEWLIGDFATTFDSLMPTSENIKLFGKEMQEAFDQTKIDLKVRPQVSWEEMKKAGWDTEEGSYSTVNTVTYLASDFGLADKYSSEDYAINVTPILPDGTVIKGGENGLWEYINGKIQNGESVEDLNIFLGKYGDIQTAENEAIKLHQMQEQYYNMVSDYSLDDDIMTTTRQITELNVALANGKISQEQYLAQMYGIGDAATKAQIKTGGLNAKLQEQGETARENAQKWKEASDNYENAKNKVADLESQIKDADGTKLTSLQGQLENAVALVAKYGREVAKYEQTEYTIKFAVDDVQKDIDEIEASYSNFADSVEFDNESGKFIMKSGIDLPQDQVDKFNEYLALLNEKYTLEVMQGEEMPTVLDVLSQIKEILEKAYTLTVDTGDAFDKTSTFKDLWDNIKDKSVTLTTIDYIIKKFGQSGDQEFSGTANVSGSAYASGNWGIKQSEHDSLVGELGEETIVDPRTGRYYTVGTNGAELVDIPKGAIIFNHRQTEELFKNGHINSRGKAYAQGNAHITVVPDFTTKNNYSGAGSYWSDFAKSIDAISDTVDDASSDSKDDFEELFDWFEVLVNELDQSIDLITAKIDNTVGANAKNSLYQQVIDLNYAKMAALNKGIELYSGKAQEFLNQIPQAYKEMAQNGAVALTDFQGEANEKVVEAIKNYREWKDKAADLNVELENIKKNISDINVQMLEAIETEYENKIGLITNLNDRIQKAMDLQEESGERLSANYYNEMIKNAQEALKLQKQQRQEMQAQLDQSVASGDIERYSENWYKMVNDINAVDEAIVQSEIDIESFQNAINELHWENFERLIKSIENVSDEAEHLRNLIKDDDITDDVGNWTEAGITALGLVSQEMENAKYRAELYGKEIEQLKKDYKAGLYSQDEYNDKLQELKSSQWDAIDAYESAKDAIVDLNKTRIEAVKDGIQKEIDAYEKLIDKRKEDLDAQKDQHDWAKTVKEHTSEIDSIQRQIDALNGDTSASAEAQRKKLQEELAKAQEELEETYYDREIEMQQKALDETLELYKEDKEKKMEELDEYLKHEEQVIADSYELVLSNSEVVYTRLNEMAKEYNIEILNSVVDPWNQGTAALGTYGESLELATSGYVAQLKLIEDELTNIQNQADATARSLIAMANAQSSQIINSGTSSKPSSSGKTSTPASKPSSTTSGKPSVGQTVTVKTSATNWSRDGGNGTRIASFVKGNSYTVKQVSGNEVLIGTSSGYTGWINKKDLIGYAKGTTGVKKNGPAVIDENGLEEIVMHTKGGKVAYLTKGTSVLPHDISENLMKLGSVDYRALLDRNKPKVGAPYVVNNDIELNLNVGEVIHVEHMDNDSLPEIQDAIQKQLDSYIKRMNNGVRKYAR